MIDRIGWQRPSAPKIANGRDAPMAFAPARLAVTRMQTFTQFCS
jgi:hypothetical protein